MIDLSRDIQSLTEFKRNTTEFLAQLRATGRPIVLTINGKAELVVQDAKSYQRLMELAGRLEAIEGIRSGLEEMKAGRGRPLSDVSEEVRRDFGLSGKRGGDPRVVPQAPRGDRSDPVHDQG